MNVLGLVFSILLILSYGYYSFYDKAISSARLRNTYLANQKVNREIFNNYESAIYNKRCKGVKTAKKSDNPNPHKREEKKEEGDEEEEEEEKPSPFNQECAKINLWPLLQEGKEAHPALYELMAKLIRSFYGPIALKEKRFEYRFVDTLLSFAKLTLQTEGKLALEKIQLEDPDLQKIYYKMLKGTKHWDLKERAGYPPLLDYIKAVPLDCCTDKICLFHANPDLLTVLFNSKIAHKLYSEVHQPNGTVTPELLERIAVETHQIRIDPDLLQLLFFGRDLPKHEKMPFVSEQGGVLLRKNLSIEG